MDQYIGKLLDNRYELLERIGSGGMAVVYKARCHRLNRLVAVKILKPDLASDAEFRRRFHDESQAVAMLSHVNIVSVYDVSSSGDLDYIVMELIDGITLKQYMQKRGVPLNWREALHFTIQIVKALGHAHSRGIIHRDIKPHNVMVLRDGSIKVADFGIARLIGGQSTLTQEALGSVHYISPEQARGSRIDGRSDLYSAGVVLYEMITGRLPFEGETPVSVAIQHINSIPISPLELNPDLPQGLGAITMKAMAPRVERRYSSADDMLEDLEEFRKNPNAAIAYAEEKEEEAEEPVDEPTQVMDTARVREESGEVPGVIPAEPEAEPAEETHVDQEKESGVQDSAVEGEEEDPAQPLPAREKKKEKKPKEKKRRKGPEEEEGVEYEYIYEDRRGSGCLAGFIAILAILGLIGGVIYFLWQSFFAPLFTAPETFAVPDLTGKTLSEIYADYDITGTFQIVVGEAIYSEEYAVGQVAKQSPIAGAVVREGGLSITVHVNTEETEEVLTMPNVLNMEQREALLLLQNKMGLVVEFKEAHSDTITAGYIMRYSPIDGTNLKRGDKVTIVVSTGPKEALVTVPMLEGLPVEMALSHIEQFGLTKGNVIKINSDNVEEGFVILQSVKAFTEVAKGTTINLQVSLGSINPSNNPQPDASDPGTDTPAMSGIKEISFDLSSYYGTVHLRVMVGGMLVMDGQVDTRIGTWSAPVSASGLQVVTFYVDGRLVSTRVVEFAS